MRSGGGFPVRHPWIAAARAELLAQVATKHVEHSAGAYPGRAARRMPLQVEMCSAQCCLNVRSLPIGRKHLCARPIDARQPRSSQAAIYKPMLADRTTDPAWSQRVVLGLRGRDPASRRCCLGRAEHFHLSWNQKAEDPDGVLNPSNVGDDGDPFPASPMLHADLHVLPDGTGIDADEIGADLIVNAQLSCCCSASSTVGESAEVP